VLVPHLLETERLRLRRMTFEDIEPFGEFLTDEESTRYMAFPADQKNPEGARDLIEMTINMYDSVEPLFVLTITLKDSDEFIGALGTSPDADTDAAEIFYAVIPEYWGKGYATEGTKRLIEYLFDDQAVDRIVAYIMPENEPSIQVARHLGMTSQGPVNRDGFNGELFLLERNS